MIVVFELRSDWLNWWSIIGWYYYINILLRLCASNYTRHILLTVQQCCCNLSSLYFLDSELIIVKCLAQYLIVQCFNTIPVHIVIIKKSKVLPFRRRLTSWRISSTFCSDVFFFFIFNLLLTWITFFLPCYLFVSLVIIFFLFCVAMVTKTNN